jgi:MSHA biogenesis protein MshK
MIALHPGVLAVTLALVSGLWLAEARAQGLSDPMQPPAFAAPASAAGGELSPGGLVLQSTLMSGGRRIAVIGGKPVKVGDRIGEARIVAIEPTSVTLREGATTRVLELYQGVEIARPKTHKPDEAQKAPRTAKGSKKGTE